MNIQKQDFDKLKQLDRIEFRQTKDMIDRRFGMSLTKELTFVFVWLIMSISLIRLPFFVLVVQPEEYTSILFMSKFCLIFFTCVLIIKYFSNVMKSIMQNVLTKKLEQEYFTSEVKVKK